MVEVLPALPAQCHLDGVHLVGHLGPNGSDDISLLPVDVSCGLSSPGTAVLSGEPQAGRHSPE